MKNSTRFDPGMRKRHKRKLCDSAKDKHSNSKTLQDNISDVKKKKVSGKSEKKKLAKLFNEKLCLLDSPPRKQKRTSKSEREKLAELFGAKVSLSSPKHETQIVSPIKDQENRDVTLTNQHKEDSAEQTKLQEFSHGQQKKKKSKRKKNEEKWNSPINGKNLMGTESKELNQTGAADECEMGHEDTPRDTSGFCPPPGIVHESLMKAKGKSRKKTSMDVEGEDEEEETPRREKADRDTSKDFRTVFVGNLPVNTNKKGLYKLFKQFGSIESVRLRCAPRSNTKLPKRAAIILRDFHPERDNISAYVCFKEEDCAKKALKMNGKLVENLHLRVDMSNHDPKTDFKRSIFVGNLPLDVKEEDIRSHFVSCGKIRNVRVIRDNKSGVGKGICYVTFKSKDSVALAMKLKGTELSGRKVRIEYCLENPQKQQKTKKDKKPQRKEDKVKKKKPNFHMRPSNVKNSAVFQKKIHSKQKKKKKRQGHKK